MPETVAAYCGVELHEEGVELEAEGDGSLDLIGGDARRFVEVRKRLHRWWRWSSGQAAVVLVSRTEKHEQRARLSFVGVMQTLGFSTVS